MQYLRLAIALAIAWLPTVPPAHGQQPTAADVSTKGNSDGREILVGINYFAGWWEPLPNKWHRRDGSDWRLDFPERLPLLGQYNDQATMDREIVAAAKYGVDFFSILWYPSLADERAEVNARFLERGIACFTASPEAGRMKFMIEFCNHRPFEVKTDGHWDRCVQYWVKQMRHASYLCVGGRLVFKVHSGGGLIQQCGGDVELAKTRLDRFRHAVADAGLGEVLIGAGFHAGMKITPEHWAAELFDFSACYMDIPQLEQTEEDYPFDTLAEHTNAARQQRGNDPICYLPYMPAGWNPRPWPDKRARFALPTANQWTLELQRMKRDLSEMEKLGLPLPDGTVQKAFTIYAWNEFGEGGFVAPTAGEKYMKLEAIEQVFQSPAPEVR